MLAFDADSLIEHYIKHYGEAVADALKRIVPEHWDVPAALRDSMSYSLMAGGKRMRPVLTIAACEALGGAAEDAMPAACAVELIHTYSLIHDDLPAMDNDDFRRGKPTNHKVYGEAMAILAGDALLTHAFYCLASMPSLRPNVPPDAALAISGELALYAGAGGMVGGQAADILGEQGVTTLEGLEYIHTHKTSDLIVFSLRAGGRIGGADDAQLAALTTFGSSIGLAFQIQDDILDVTGDAEKLGKSVNSDVEQNKVTYPYLIGLERSRAMVAELTERGKSALTAGNVPDPRRLLQLADYLMSRES
ncbi:polyprenyl synthetase family protein [Paenibacillus thermotolerans]|uniref:polyprenyl synthetase family protein n=1 Tax=Paenibacillus thermotolerans TaxID=3027807 RepID=UPI0023684AB8|nr:MULTISPECIES: farnesyl diphosphate synthase [unclassified Paenibacillus]